MSEQESAEMLRQGIAAARAGRKEEAREALLQVVELDEQNEQAWLWLSSTVDSAEEKRICLENVLTINPGNTHAQAGLKWLEEHAPAPPAPASDQEHCPHCGAAVPPSGTTCPQCGQPLLVACPACGEYVDIEKPACPACGHTLGDYRQGARYYLALANSYLERRRFDLADEALAYAQSQSGADTEAMASVAALYEKIGDDEQAIAAYRQAIEIEPEKVALYLDLCKLYRRQSRLEQARATVEKARGLSDDDPEVLFQLAQISFEQDGPSPEVLELLQRVVQKQPMNAEAFIMMGDAYLAEDHHKQARQQYEHACELTSPNSQIGQEARRKLDELLQPPQRRAEAGTIGSERPYVPARRGRPGCVSVYALLTGLGAVLGILSALGLAALLFVNRASVEEALRLGSEYYPLQLGQISAVVGVYVLFMLVVSSINLAIAIGLWNMKNWARITVIALQALAMLGSLCQAGAFISSFRQTMTASGVVSIPSAFLCGLFFSFAIQGYIIFWFFANRELFD